MSLLMKKKLSQREIEATPYLLRSYPQFLLFSGVLSFSEYIKYFIMRKYFIASVTILVNFLIICTKILFQKIMIND